MKTFFYIIAIMLISYGVLLILYAEQARRYFKKFFIAKQIKILAVLPCIIGATLIIGAFLYRDFFWISFILGLASIIKGTYLFVAPEHHVRTLLDWWFEKADTSTLRLLGLFTFIVGIIMLSSLM